jgi:hypothetical protein
MKKYALWGLLFFSALNLAGNIEQSVSANEPGGGLKCSHLAGCRTSAGCSGAGTPSGCTIVCQDQVVVTCPNG